MARRASEKKDAKQLADDGVPTTGLLDLVPSAVSIQDLDFRIRRINETFRRMFGERVGEHCYTVYKGRSEVCLDCPMAKTFEDRRVHRSEEAVRTIDGKNIQVAVQTAPLTSPDGKVIAGMEVATDISRTVAAQQELVLLGQAMAGMAHYIKNILTGLEGGVFVVEEGIATNDKKLLREGWEMVRRNIERVSKLSRDQLYCSRDKPPEERVANPNDVVRDAALLYCDRVKAAEIELIVDLDPRVREAGFDPEGLHNLVTNLLSNALDACRFDPDADRKRHWISVKTFLESGGQFHLEVAENGQGIPKEMTSDVFSEMFTTKGSRGTGLGLLVVYRVVCAHGGQITVMSDEGVGSVFNVLLPLS